MLKLMSFHVKGIGKFNSGNSWTLKDNDHFEVKNEKFILSFNLIDF